MANPIMYPLSGVYDKIVVPSGMGGYTSPTTAFASDLVGGATTQFDITNPAGSTFRYTYDGTGADPEITALTVQTYKKIWINAQNFNAANNGFFYITGSGDDYFEVTNAAGVAENNVTIGTGEINLCSRFLVQGEFDETADTHIYSGQSIEADDALFSHDADHGLIMNNRQGVRMKGRLTLEGTGMSTSYDYALAYLQGVQCDLLGCRIIGVPDYTAVGANDVHMFRLSGSLSTFYITANGVDIDTAGGAHWARAVSIAAAAADNFFRINLKDITANTPSALRGIYSEGDRNTINANVHTVTTDTGNLGTCVEFIAGSDSNCIYGVALGGDQAQLTDGGANNKSGELAVA